MDQLALDRDIQHLQQHKQQWARLPIVEKIALVAELRRHVLQLAPRQVERALQAKGIAPNTPTAGEEWLGGPIVTLRNLRQLEQSLREIEEHGRPQVSARHVHTRADGQVVVDVIPYDQFDQILYAGFHAQVWMEPEVTAETLPDTMGVFYQQNDLQGAVALVLGAGNVASIGPLDVIYKLFVEGQVCLLKLNPVNDYLGPFIEQAFAPLIDAGYLRLAYGGVAEGSYLCQHPGIDTIHITGSDKTHDAIVYGVGPEGERRKKEDTPKLDKEITSELGNVSPIIVVPGQWSEKELVYQAQNVATQMTNNAGFNCNAAKLLLTHKDWPQRQAFLNTLHDTLKQVGPRYAYYPGAEERFTHFTQGRAQLRLIGEHSDGMLPWALITDLDPHDPNEICFREESFCGVTAETALHAYDPGDFLERAVDFCNQRLWGTLNACILIDPRTQKQHAQTLDLSIANLRYGSIVVNHWPAMSYAMGSTTWGAYPGHTNQDIQSGIGFVHNTKMFDKAQKSVITGPFYSWPRPPWFAPYKANLHRMTPALARFEASPSFAQLPKLLWYAITQQQP